MPEPPARRPTLRLVRWLFLRALGFVYLCAFLSLWLQVEGLVGSRGILPARELLEWVRSQAGAERYWALPTLFWLSPSDTFLHVLCGGGALLSLLLVAGVAPVPVLVLLWAFYLSLSTIGQIFLGYQWDALLLETGFLAIFFAPGGIRPRPGREAPPPLAILWLLRWLLFRLMFSSGVVKLASGDATWRNLTALEYHYWSQPLPTWIGWYAHQLPPALQSLSVAVTFGIELAVPFLVFGGRRARLAACATLVAFQLLIAATGNYAFFNLLAIALCVLLLEDEALPRSLRERLGSAGPPEDEPAAPQWRLWAHAPFVAIVLVLSTVQLLGSVGFRLPWPQPVVQLYRALAPFSSVNSYGLFAMMTTARHEIFVEGSEDGATWLPYEFRSKPGVVTSPPAFVAPHQPRLDWQMWFAALGSCEENSWLIRLLLRLQEGSPPVLGLFARNPFPARPPRLIRAVLYDYHFTDLRERRATGAWWRRDEMGLYCPVLTRPDEPAR